MSTTYINMKCKKCGYSYRTSIYGYMEDPIGIPIMRCPNCNELYKDAKHKEWIQMSPIKKYFSISPMGNLLSMFIAIIPVFLLSKICNFGDEPSTTNNLIFLGSLFVSWLICNYVVICIRANCWKFYDRIIPSISRTRNEPYTKILSRFGKIYGEAIPRFVIFTKASRATIEYEVENNKTDNFEIPTFSDSINKY